MTDNLPDDHLVELTVEDGWLRYRLLCNATPGPDRPCAGVEESLEGYPDGIAGTEAEDKFLDDWRDEHGLDYPLRPGKGGECWLQSWTAELMPDEMLRGKVIVTVPALVGNDGDVDAPEPYLKFIGKARVAVL